MLIRPEFHHAPRDGWMNDPVGLCRTGAEWRLHYQRAVDREQRAMGWGTAVSGDLLHWRAEPDAIQPDAESWIYSGSVVQDASGFAHRYAAFYTRHDPASQWQRQELAVSDDGAHWRAWGSNPLIDEGRPETRDPFVFAFNGGWRMLVAEPVAWTRPTEGRSRVAIYASPNLLDWQRLGDLGVVGEPELMFETPLLRQLPIEGEPSASWPWLLLAGVIDRSGDGARCSTRAWLGTFDGSSFTPSQPPEPLDHGPDFYAAAAWAGTGEELIVTSWANSWAYARQLPGDGWNGGVHALPRRLTGRRLPDGRIAILQSPAALPEGRAVAASDAGNAFLVHLTAPSRLVIGDGALVFDLAQDGVTLERGRGDAELRQRGFEGQWSAALPAGWSRATLAVDGCIAELFVDDVAAMTALFTGGSTSLSVGGEVRVEAVHG